MSLCQKRTYWLLKEWFLTVLFDDPNTFHFEPSPPIKLMHCFLAIDELTSLYCKALRGDGLYISGCDKVGHLTFALLTWRSEVNSSLPTECGLVVWLLINRTQWQQGCARFHASAWKDYYLLLPVSCNSLWKTKTLCEKTNDIETVWERLVQVLQLTVLAEPSPPANPPSPSPQWSCPHSGQPVSPLNIPSDFSQSHVEKKKKWAA